jgi:hydrogenase nickel incorporation protein HypB
MCESCGCEHNIPAAQKPSKKIPLNFGIMEKNDALAQRNKEIFLKEKLVALNLISSPGSGKTSLLQAMAAHFRDTMGVIVGDIQTRRDAERIEAAGSAAWQIETGGACHLDAGNVGLALSQMTLSGLKLLVIENIGNLVCPAGYFLGEELKIGLLSTPEGDDKVLKYPALFSKIAVLIISKIDLLPHLNFNVDRAVEECRSLNPDLTVFELSAKTGKGLPAFFQYLESRFKK